MKKDVEDEIRHEALMNNLIFVTDIKTFEESKPFYAVFGYAYVISRRWKKYEGIVKRLLLDEEGRKLIWDLKGRIPKGDYNELVF